MNREIGEWVVWFRTNQLSEECKDLIGMASFDLWFGPFSQGDFEEENPDRKTVYPGFSTACDKIRSELSENVPPTLFISDYGDWSELEPDWDSECCEDWTRYDYRDLVKELVGKEFAQYVW